MELRKLTEKDLAEAGRIAFRIWAGEIASIPESMRPALYEYLVRYYFQPESDYNYAAVEDGKLYAFLLAAPAGTAESCRAAAAEWIQPYLKTDEERNTFAEYRAYLDSNTEIEDGETAPGEVVMLLLGSLRPGCGKMILQAFDGQCRANGIPGTLLWTDETCDFDYYTRHGFRKTADFLCPVALGGTRFRTWIFRKSF